MDGMELAAGFSAEWAAGFVVEVEWLSPTLKRLLPTGGDGGVAVSAAAVGDWEESPRKRL